jgi:hypothetical protein
MFVSATFWGPLLGYQGIHDAQPLLFRVIAKT